MIQIQPTNTNREDWLAYALEKGLSFEVLDLSSPKCVADEKMSADIEAWYRSTHLATSLHGAFIDVNPASGDKDFAEFSRKRCMRSCEQALRLGAKNVVFHSSCFSILRGQYLASWADSCAEFYNSLIEKYGLNIFIENSQDIDPGPIRTLMDLCNNPKLSVCFDTGHANCSPTGFKTWFSELRDYIGYIHLSDNMGRYDDHMALGTGTINWEMVDICFRALPEERRKNMNMTFECGGLESVKSSISFLETNSYMGFGKDRESLDPAVLDVPEDDSSNIKEENLILGERNNRLFDTIGLYLSEEIARQIVDTNGGTRFGGKIRELTVLLSDLRGFSALAESLAPDDLLNMLSHYFDAMVTAVRKNNGTVLEFVGDSVFAIFGAPIDLKDHADKAVSAAIDMQALMKEVNRWNLEHGYPALHMGIGINTGDLIIGNIGCKQHIKYGVIGNAINMCSRIESFTVGGQIFISPTTYESLNGKVEVASENKIFPKGFKTPITVFDVKALDGKTFGGAKSEALKKLQSPVRLSMRVVSDKMVSADVYSADVIKLSCTEAIIYTRTALRVFDDIRFDIYGQRLYGKVIQVLQKRSPLDPKTKCLIRFTSIPSGFEKWYNSIKFRNYRMEETEYGKRSQGSSHSGLDGRKGLGNQERRQ